MRKFSYKSKYIFLIAVALLVAIVFSTLLTDTPTAYADSTYDVVFPSSGYFQAEHPTLIAANADYLFVYDATQNLLYSRSNTAEIGRAHV